MTKTVLITGCSSGLGLTSARKFASEGWNVVATMRRPENRIAEDYPARIFVTALDVTDPASVKAAIDAGLQRFGRIDAVVNNAGISMVSIFEAMDMQDIRRLFETNLFGTMNVMQAILPEFRRQGGGAIVNVTSAVGFAAAPLLSIYTSTKHAVEGLSESLSYELSSHNIRIKLVEPGAMRTTKFTDNTVAVSPLDAFPAEYKAYGDHMLGSMMNYPFEDADENAVAATVYEAANDPSDRLRYLAGPDAEEMAAMRWSSSEAHYMARMRELMGHAAWLAKQSRAA